MPDIHLPSWGRGLVLRRWILTFALTLLNFAGWNLHAQRADFDDLLRQLPPLQRHVNGPVNGTQQGSGELYQEFANEKFGGRWFAALLPHSNPPSYSILQRFQSWNRFIDFLQTHDAIIDVWAYGDAANGALRRMPASELAALQKTRYEQPTMLTVTYRGTDGAIVTNRVEFGLNAARTALAANESYLRHRQLQRKVREILSARDENGILSAQTQWESLSAAALAGEFPIAAFPAQPGNSNDLFVAFEYALDELGNFDRILRVFRESEVRHRVLQEPGTGPVQVLILKKPFEPESIEARGYRRLAAGGSLVPAPNPIQGEDDVELRVRNSAQADPEKWNLIEFGEPELVRQSALAKFSLISAHLERQRKQVALKRSTFDLIAEPIFLGLNLGGGVTGVPFPIGEAARLGYNALVVPPLIADVPTPKQLRELLLLLAARERHPEIRLRPQRFLSEADLRALKQTASHLTDTQLHEFVERVSDDDLKAMLELAKLQKLDAQVSTLIAIFTSAAKVSGVSESGVLRQIFNSPYFSATGDISLKTLIAVAAGGKVATPFSGISLETLSQGHGPGAAWLQFLDFTVDIRAVMNTAHRLVNANLADKELKKPFPYAPRLSDLAAYELRIFGYPLLIWYKRGLLKDDIASFDNDYAYGLLGARIVEHFKTKEEMDAEIRAGAMVPLGYVLIPDKKIGWRESNLAVFAHRIRAGKHKGKTAIIIYGLKAYEQNSELIEREYHRLKQFEHVLADGGVIERTIRAEKSPKLPPQSFEAKFHSGSNAVEQIYSPLLGLLSEWRRVLRRRSLSLSQSPQEQAQASALEAQLQAYGIRTDDKNLGDPLIAIDRHNSTFIFRKYVDGAWRIVQLTLIPSIADVQQQLAKAEDSARIEAARREAYAQGSPVVLINRAQQVAGRYEVGPLLRDDAGVTAGLRSGSNVLEATFAMLDQLPIADRIRLEFNQFASTLLDLPLDTDGKTQKVFLAIEFPSTGDLSRSSTNALTGELERSTFKAGSTISTITRKRILERDRNEQHEEVASRSFANIGTIENPTPGPLIEQTKTLETWPRPANDRSIDPYQPTFRKLRLNHITGEVRRETYGLFDQPLEIATDQTVATNQFDLFGRLASSEVCENGTAEAEFDRPSLTKILQPIKGEPRLRLVRLITNAPEQQIPVQQVSFVQTDLLKHISKTVTFDGANGGRKVTERFTDAIPGGPAVETETSFQYRDDFLYGLIPMATAVRNPATGIEFFHTQTKNFDPQARRITALQTEYTGATVTKIWDYRWDDAIETETDLRRTTNSFDRQGLFFRSVTVGKQSGEAISTSSGNFDSSQNRWVSIRDLLYRPGVTNRSETEIRTPFGNLLAIRMPGDLQVRPVYDNSGILRSNEVALLNPASGAYDNVQRIETDFVWQQGARRARVDTFIAGKLHASFYALNDSAGRTVTNNLRQVGPLELYTAITYDGDSDRVIKAEEYQNGKIRTARLVQSEQRDAMGRTILPVRIIPFWGLTSTQIFLLGEPLGRPQMTVYENGATVQVMEWFSGTDLPRRTETRDRQGNVIERALIKPGSHLADGVTLDGVMRFKVDHFGHEIALGEEVLVPETQIAWFSESGAERTYFDLRKLYLSPRYVLDLSEHEGMTVSAGSSNLSHVVSVLTSELIQPSAVRTNYRYSEPVVAIQAIDLRTLFFHKITHQIRDRAGNLLDERIGHIPFPGQNGYREEALINHAPHPTRKFHYRYEPGWLVQETDNSDARLNPAYPTSSAQTWRFRTKAPPPGTRAIAVNDGTWKEFATEIQAVQAPSEEALDSEGVRNYVFRKIQSPRQLEHNPYMPGTTNVWTAWTATELGIDGQILHQSETLYDGRGNLSVSRVSKSTSAGEPAQKLAYKADASLIALQELRTRNSSLDLAAGKFPADFSNSDFIYFAVNSSSNLLAQITDTRGKSVQAHLTRSDFARGIVQFYDLDPAFACWLPNSRLPRQGVTIDHVANNASNQLLAISTHDLACSGLDIHSIRQIRLRQIEGRTIQASPVFQFLRNSPWIDDRNPEYLRERQSHSSGITTLMMSARDRAPREIYAGQRTRATAEYNGLPIAVAYSRFKNWDFPFLIIQDNSDPEAPRPLYALSPKDGQFLEHYKMVKLGDAQVYSVVRGFDLPHLDVFRAAVLDDELGPGYVAYGDEYQVSIEYARGRTALGQVAAALQNRIAANAFRYLGARLLTRLQSDPSVQRLSHFNYESIHDAHVQAREINALPTLAETLLPSRPLPWDQATPIDNIDPDEDWSALKFRLANFHLRYPTGLIPTALDTAVERYVDTAREADLVILATRLSELGVAKEILEFYWDKSRAGQQPLHSSYDAESGMAMQPDVMFKRPLRARRTALAQLAIADAAFQLGLETSDPRWLTFGRNLLQLVLGSFRPPAEQDQPRGISELVATAARHSGSLTFWPEAATYSLRSNARAYLLLARLSEILPRFSDRQWRLEMSDALKEQEHWLRLHVLSQLERTGIVPDGVFEIQDVKRETTAVAAQRWTSTEDWLLFLQAAHKMGVAQGTLQHSLDNLGRLHGTRIGSVWGLDWTIPLLRPDAISPEFTAEFWQTARMLDHKSAAAFARHAISGLRVGANYPSVITLADPNIPLATTHGAAIYSSLVAKLWPVDLNVYKHLRTAPGWDFSKAPAQLQTKPVDQVWKPQRTDVAFFGILAGTFYSSILIVAFLWWRFRALRRAEQTAALPEELVPKTVMQLAEERWASRVMALQVPNGAEQTRFSNAPLEQNFLMQLRTIYKLLLEWRRQENGWAEDDRRLAESDTDDWINGADEFVTVIGLYMRWVIKAGAKDGFEKTDVLQENEDSNHIWSRLVMYLSEYYWGLLSLVRSYNNFVTAQDKASLHPEIARLLSSMGLRQRTEPFDGRTLFNFPTNPAAMDLLLIQKRGMTLDKLASEISVRLRIPFPHIVHIIEQYKRFKRREAPYPLHPYAIEFAKVLPHFLIMGLGALAWYNRGIGDSSIILYLWSIISKAALSPISLVWAIPIFLGILASAVGSVVRVYRFDAPMLARRRGGLIFDATLTSLFMTGHATMPRVREGWKWNPRIYERIAWSLRSIAFLTLAIALLRLDTPSFATFLLIKGLLAMLALSEVIAVALPVVISWLSKALQDYLTAHPGARGLIHSLNKLNFTAVRPASPIALSFRYHFQPSVPSGTFGSMAQAILFYFVLAAVFFFVGAYLCQQIFSLWFTDTYLNASDWKLFFGGLLFWNTMYLLRYGLFVLFTGIASALVTFPIRTAFALLALLFISLSALFPDVGVELTSYPSLTYGLMVIGLAGIFFEAPIVSWFRSRRRPLAPVASSKADTEGAVGIVYMSGDDLSHLKLTADLLMDRWTVLRDKLNSRSLSLLHSFSLSPEGTADSPSPPVGESAGVRARFIERESLPDDQTLKAWFDELYQIEKRAQCTLWIPSQLVAPNETPAFRPQLGLNIEVSSAEQRNRLLLTWHIRRWLVSMMSTAGHSQDTAINLVDMALRFRAEGLAARTVFYLIQNKYDDSESNRPSQLAYCEGELAHRNKLARLLRELAPGARAYNLQNWTPFGFKAGGLMAMDLAHEEALKLQTFVLLDRNATVHDLDAFMRDVRRTLADAGLIIVIPGRSTTNTLTSIGQGSQMVEEGHRSFLKGLMGLLGGRASESIGTGWGNIVAATYGRVQSALLEANSLKMPLTSRMWRGSSFAVRTEGLIGFAAHAVGISEDIWAVSQAAHNAIGLGQRVKFGLSEAIWHKIRETWSHSEWLASFPRWSGGYLQMMQDPIMQRINDLGPQSIFAKEVRANSGRNFLMAPFALLNVLVMPLAIMLDLTPFVQILLLLWNFGFVMNQVLTINALNTYLESSGFYAIPAALGGAAAGFLCLKLANVQAFAPAFVILGALAGGFIVGWTRWLYTRVRDLLLFGPQLVLHALGQIIRQSLEFVVSGASPEDAKGVNMAFRAWAGPREDRPLERFSSAINLKTVIWFFGMTSLVLNLLALFNLDLLNVLLLLPSLLFTVSILAGPFLLKPRVGSSLRGLAFLPRLCGWVASLFIYISISLWLPQRGALHWLGLSLLGIAVAILLHRGLRYCTYRVRLRRGMDALARLLTQFGIHASRAREFALQLIPQAPGNVAALEEVLARGGVEASHRSQIIQFLDQSIVPLLRTPSADLRSSRFANNRWVSEFSRSWVLSLLVMLWLFVVPVPGLFVFTAGGYRVSLGLWRVASFITLAIALAVVGAWLGDLIQRFDADGPRKLALKKRIRRAFAQFQQQLQSSGSPLAQDEISSTFALFTDIQTYMDQRSYAFAHRLLATVEARLRGPQ